MTRLTIAVLVPLLASLAAAGQATPRATGFGPRVTNPWFPLAAGTTFVYRGSRDGKAARDIVTVTTKTTTIDGVRCATVRDRLFLNGRLRERTTDWYAQDTRGNVWYFGEATAELNATGAVTSTEGSWRAGTRGAHAGIVMPARPAVGQRGRQEYLSGHAEDHFQILSLAARVRTPAVRSRHALLTKEWTPLEPGVVDHKLYVRRVGLVQEQTVRGGSELMILVQVRRGRNAR